MIILNTETLDELYYLLGQQFANMEKMLKIFNGKLKDEILKLKNENQIEIGRASCRERV